MTKVLTRIVTVLLACIMLTACGPKDLESLMNQADNKKQLDEQIQSLMSNPTYKNMFKDIKWEAKGNSLTYAYYYAQEFSDDQLAQIKSNLEAQGDTLKTTVENLKAQIEKGVGIRPDSITYIYYDAADKEIAKLSY